MRKVILLAVWSALLVGIAVNEHLHSQYWRQQYDAQSRVLPDLVRDHLEKVKIPCTPQTAVLSVSVPAGYLNSKGSQAIFTTRIFEDALGSKGSLAFSGEFHAKPAFHQYTNPREMFAREIDLTRPITFEVYARN